MNCRTLSPVFIWSRIKPSGTQAKFDALMRDQMNKGALVWSSPDVQTKMGAKDALCKIANMG